MLTMVNGVFFSEKFALHYLFTVNALKGRDDEADVTLSVAAVSGFFIMRDLSAWRNKLAKGRVQKKSRDKKGSNKIRGLRLHSRPRFVCVKILLPFKVYRSKS